MIVIYILVGLVVIFLWFKLMVVANTAQLNNLRRPDGSYADYDFPGILNSGKSTKTGEPDRKQASSHEDVDRDLYGRPLPPDLAQKRTAEVNSEKQTVFVLMHTPGNDTPPKLLGVYGSRDSAQAAIGRYRQQEEFAHEPDSFHCVEHKLDEDS